MLVYYWMLLQSPVTGPEKFSTAVTRAGNNTQLISDQDFWFALTELCILYTVVRHKTVSGPLHMLP